MTRVIATAALCCGMIGAASAAEASPVTVYTSSAAFNTATTGQSVATFDDLGGGATIASGGSADGITFTYSIPAKIEVEDAFATTSSPNSLGTVGDGVFIAGDAFTITFGGPVQAVGLYLIAGDIINAGDFRLSIAGGFGDNGASPDGFVSDGTKVFFLGLTNPDGFTSATLTSFSANGADFFFNVDDVTTGSIAENNNPVPEPSSLLLLASGGAMALRRLRRRKLI